MTSGNFTTVLVDSITVVRDERQRRELNGIEELAQSISRTGLIHPPVITKDNILIAGERRLTAVKSLGWTSIPVQYAEDLDPLQLQLIELEENTRRVDIDWQDNCRAVEKYHKLRQQIEKDWTPQKTADALGVSRTSILQQLDVASALNKGVEQVVKADKYSVARGIVQRATARAKTIAVNNLFEPAQTKSDAPILNTNFIEWSENYTGNKFNFLHCDFPYGVNVGGHGQAADQAFGNYNDDPKTYWLLLDALGKATERLIAPEAHMMFWFSMKFYERTRLILMEQGWAVNLFPLIWFKSDNSGILPDSDYGPRRNYETAFHCIRGKRPIVRAVSNVYAGPNTKSIHMSEKPVECLEHFFRMYVDESTRLLDPTCGSANALKAAQRFGAAEVLGIERDKNFYEAAVSAWG